MNARRQIERLLPAFVFTKISLRAVSRGFSTSDTGELDPDTERVVSVLRRFIDDGVDAIPAKDRPTFSRRLERASEELMAPMVDRKLVLAFIAALEFMQELVDTHRWEYPDGELAEAIDAILTAVSQYDDLLDTFEKTGKKRGRQMVRHAEQLGYYQ